MKFHGKAPRFRTNNQSVTDALNKLADYMDSIPAGKRIIAGENIRKYENESEIILHGTPAGAQALGATPCECTFPISFEESSSKGKLDFNIGYGVINGQTIDRHEGIETGIDPEEENPTAKFIYLDITLSAVGGVTNATIVSHSNIQDPVEPLENEIPTNVNVIHGVLVGTKYYRLLPCTGIAVYPTILCMTADAGCLNKYYTIEVAGI